MTDKIRKFLMESNAIEGVYDAESLMQAEEAWNFLISQTEVSIHVICKMHKILMLHQNNLMPNEKGYLRTIPVFVGGREAMECDVIHDHLENLAKNINDVVQNAQSENVLFQEEIIKHHHVEYEMIHPFVDGNGRTGRMLMNWERLCLGLPVLIIWESEKQDYYKWFI